MDRHILPRFVIVTLSDWCLFQTAICQARFQNAVSVSVAIYLKCELSGGWKSSSLNITYFSQKTQQVSSVRGRTGESTWRLYQRSLLARSEKAVSQPGSEHGINGAYLKDIREQSSCHLPVMKYRNPAFQHTVPCLYESDSPVSFLPCLISTCWWRMLLGHRCIRTKLDSGSSYGPLQTDPGDVKGWGQRRTNRCWPRSPSFTI